MATQKDAILEKAEARLQQIDAEIDLLKAKAEEAEADVKFDLQKRLKDVQSHRREFENRISELKDAGEGAISELRDGVERAWSQLSDAAGRAKARF
jgi:chromosome segregation ATPase